MKFHCDICGKEATVHLTEVVGDEKIEKHLCEDCAVSEGVTVKVNQPLVKMLESLTQATAQKEMAKLRCEVCGISFLDFRQQQVLGCPNDYRVFEDILVGLLERAHEGASYHVGKVPVGVDDRQRRQNELLRLQGELREAVASERYEQAAELRDRIQELGGS